MPATTITATTTGTAQTVYDIGSFPKKHNRVLVRNADDPAASTKVIFVSTQDINFAGGTGTEDTPLAPGVGVIVESPNGINKITAYASASGAVLHVGPVSLR